MLDLQTIKSYVLHFKTLEIKISGNLISLPHIITRKKAFHSLGCSFSLGEAGVGVTHPGAPGDAAPSRRAPRPRWRCRPRLKAMLFAGTARW